MRSSFRIFMNIDHESQWLKKSIAGLLGLVGISIVVQGIVIASHPNTDDMLIGAMLIIVGLLFSFAAWRLWPSSISDKGKEKIVEDDLEKVLSNAKTMSPNEFHTKMCYVLMAMAVIGGVFSFIGYILAPDSCGDENTVFEDLGFALFMMSMIGVPINIIIWLGSLFKSNVDSAEIFVLVILHTLVVILIMFVFGDNYIAQDMFCDSEVFVGGVF